MKRLVALAVLIATAPVSANMGRADRALSAPTAPRFKSGPAPSRYTTAGTYQIEITTFEDVQVRCRATRDEPKAACTLGRAPNPVVIVITDPTDRRVSRRYGELIAHEIAHAQGWPADHPE